jgi:hypothetical protein
MAAATIPCSDRRVREHARKQLELPSRSSPATGGEGRTAMEKRKKADGGERGIPQRWLEQAMAALRWDHLCRGFSWDELSPSFTEYFKHIPYVGYPTFY